MQHKRWLVTASWDEHAYNDLVVEFMNGDEPTVHEMFFGRNTDGSIVCLLSFTRGRTKDQLVKWLGKGVEIQSATPWFLFDGALAEMRKLAQRVHYFLDSKQAKPSFAEKW